MRNMVVKVHDKADWMGYLSVSELNELSRAIEKRDEAMSDYKAKKVRLKNRAGQRRMRKQQASK